MSERPIVGARQLCTLLFLSLTVDMVIRSLTASGMPSAQKAIPAALLDAAIVSLLLSAQLRGQRLGTGAAWNGKAWGTKFLLCSAELLLAAAGAGAGTKAGSIPPGGAVKGRTDGTGRGGCAAGAILAQRE